jgi:death-on-curing protein
VKRLRWLTAKAVLAIHEELIVRYGGVSGLRDDGLLESAVARPQNLAAYGQKISVASLSAAYAWGCCGIIHSSMATSAPRWRRWWFFLS